MIPNEDIAGILEGWECEPDTNVRKIVDGCGREKVQVRVQQGAFQGILQMELDGRPDGLRPYGFEYYLDYYQHALNRHIEKHGSDRGFALDHKSCDRLIQESRRIYERYVFLLQINEFPRVIEDTERNMSLFELVHLYAACEDDRMALQKRWPYLLRMHAEAQILPLLEAKKYVQVGRIIRRTIGRIEALDDLDIEEFRTERRRSLRYLSDMARKLQGHVPAERPERLRQELMEAIFEEHFERAAEIRDELRKLGAELPAYSPRKLPTAGV